jgi:hypothetical protein
MAEAVAVAVAVVALPVVRSLAAAVALSLREVDGEHAGLEARAVHVVHCVGRFSDRFEVDEAMRHRVVRQLRRHETHIANL